VLQGGRLRLDDLVAQGGDVAWITGDSIVVDSDAKVVTAHGAAAGTGAGSGKALSARVVSRATACTSTKNQTSNNHIVDGERVSIKVSWSGDGCSLTFEAEGKVTIAPDLSDITDVAPGGWAELTERDEVTRRYEVRRRNGALERRYTVDGERREIDADARRWIAEALLAVERRTAAFAPSRVRQIFESRGANAVLEEIGRLGSDHSRRVYLTALFDLEIDQDDAFLARAIAQAGRDIGSDYELRVVLNRAAKEPHFGAAATAAALRASRTLESDYERRVTLTSLLGRSALNDAGLRDAIESTESMSSDYERRVVLMAAAKRPKMDAQVADAYLDAAARISSDYERRVVLMALLQQPDLSDETLAGVFRSVRAMSSDTERRTVLVTAVRGRTLRGPAAEAFDAAVDAMSSDSDRNVVLRAAGRSTTKQQWSQ
jgi:hypothetical protein